VTRAVRATRSIAGRLIGMSLRTKRPSRRMLRRHKGRSECYGRGERLHRQGRGVAGTSNFEKPLGATFAATRDRIVVPVDPQCSARLKTVRDQARSGAAADRGRFRTLLGTGQQ
jgi:hypothetical protein